jgi:hypothetical protein
MFSSAAELDLLSSAEFASPSLNENQQVAQKEERALNTYSTILQKKTHGYTGMLVISSLIMIFVWGCLENYGRLKRSEDVKTAFETGQLPSDYHYHFYGNRNHPFAMMGLDPDWTLKSKMWRPVELNTDEFKYMAKWVWEDIGYSRGGKYGAQILDPEFVKIGIIYTASWMATVKVDKDTKTVEVMPHVFQGGR